MVHPLIGIHATLGELGIFSLVWVFIELINPDKQRLKRAKIGAFLAVIFFILSWLSGGYYYTVYYGEHVKPLIKEGPTPWAHGIVMETKEHIYLFIPFLSFTIFSLINFYNERITKEKNLKKSLLLLIGLAILSGFAMALFGYIISTGFRAALEVMHIG